MKTILFYTRKINDMSSTFIENLAFGQEGEHLVAQALIRRGCAVLGLYQFETPNFAPYVLSQQGNIIAPDLVYFKGGKTFLGEVKTKTRWLYTGDLLETGLDVRHYETYKRLQNKAQVPMYLFFNHVEKAPTGIYALPLDCQNFRVWEGKTPLVIFPITELTKISD